MINQNCNQVVVANLKQPNIPKSTQGTKEKHTEPS
jgi:hypothetical protein